MPSGSKLPDTSPYSKAQGIEFAADSSGRMKVKIDAVSSSVSIGGYTVVTMKSVSVSNACTVHAFTAAGTVSVLAAQGSTTATEIRGFSLGNGSTLTRRFDLKFGSTSFWIGHLPGGGAFNWNFINGYPRSASNKKVVLYASDAVTASVSVYWKKA
jgi:hypothetical protein